MYPKILVPVDGSATSQRGLDEALKVASGEQSCVRLLHVVDELSLMLMADAMGSLSGDVVTALVDGGRAILEAARAQVAARGVEPA